MINISLTECSLKPVQFSVVLQHLEMRVVVPKYLRRKETMIYSHYFATKTSPIYFSQVPEHFVLIS